MAEHSKIEWTDNIDAAATGRRLGAYKSAAKKLAALYLEQSYG